MARLSRPKAGGASRGNYESLDNDIPADESSSGLTNENESYQSSQRLASRGKPDDADLLSSGDELTDNEADVKLLPLKNEDTRRGPSSSARSTHRAVIFDTPSASSSSLFPNHGHGDEDENNEISVPKEQQDVGKRIENYLETERRTLLAESFRTDIEDANTDFILSDDEDDYGVPIKPRLKEEPRWKLWWNAVFGKRTWWHICFFFVSAILMIWLALQGLVWIRGDKAAEQEYVSFPSTVDTSRVVLHNTSD